MKLVSAIINPSKLDEARDALHHAGAPGLSVTEIRGYGRQKGHTEQWRGSEYEIDFIPKVKIEVGVDDSSVDDVIDAIRRVAQTGTIGDGKIFVTPLEKVMRIRTGEVGAAAL